MKETIAKIMRSGGYAVILATVAMALYLFVLEMGNKFIESQSVELKVTIDENGYLSTNYGGDKKDVYVLWQTDGGCIKPVKENNNLKAQNEEGNKWYFAYTGPNEKIVWDKADADGSNYSQATIRATVYLSKEATGPFHVYEYISDASITVEKKDNKTSKCGNRLFSNPVRESSDKEWSQIYEVSKDGSTNKTYMYRTGSDIKNAKDMMMVWEANESNINETDLIQGTVSSSAGSGVFGVNAANSGKKIIMAVPSITFNVDNIGEDFHVEAYLTSSSNNGKEAGDIKDEEKFYKAEIIVNK